MIIRDDTGAPPPEPAPAGPTAPPAAAPDMAERPLGELRPDLELFRGSPDEDGRPTWVIFDPAADTYFRLSDADYRIVRLWTGNPILGEFREKLARAGIHADEPRLLRLAAFLIQSNLTRAGYQVSERKARALREQRKKMFWHMLLNYYLFFRIPLWTPDRFIVRTRETVEAFFNRWVLWGLRLLAGFGYLFLIANWYKFADAFVSSISVQGMLRYSAAVIVIKIIHEFSHAYTARHYGCRVRRMGIAFIFFFPRLYTDLTDSWRVREPRRRFLIDGAGIFSELIIGGIAALIWANTGDGLTHTVAYYIFSVSIINTVLINGNPFIRYDGYYMLMDLVNIDNLQKRGVEIVRNWWRSRLFGLEVPPETAHGWKKGFLFGYGIGMFIYRIFLYFSIILLVYFNFAKALGIVLLFLEVYLMIAKPIIGEVQFLIMNRQKLNRRRTLWSLAGAALLVALLVAPLPWRIAAPCEIRAAGGAMVYAPADGFIDRLPPADGTAVTAGELLMTQTQPLLELRKKEAELQLRLDELQLDQTERSDQLLAQSPVVRQALAGSRALIEELDRRLQLQNVAAPVAGVFTRHDRHLTPGRYLARGALIGAVHPERARAALAYVPEDDVKFIRSGDRVEVMLNGDLRVYTGRILGLRELPPALEPSPVLDVFGGTLLTRLDENQSYVPLTACYLADIELDRPAPVGRSGIAAIARFSSLGGNLWRGAVRVLRQELSF